MPLLVLSRPEVEFASEARQQQLREDLALAGEAQLVQLDLQMCDDGRSIHARHGRSHRSTWLSYRSELARRRTNST